MIDHETLNNIRICAQRLQVSNSAFIREAIQQHIKANFPKDITDIPAKPVRDPRSKDGEHLQAWLVREKRKVSSDG